MSTPPTEADPPRSGLNLTARALISIVVGGSTILLLAEGYRRLLPQEGRLIHGFLTMATALPIVYVLVRKVVHRGVREAMLAVSDGLLSLTEKDYSMRLAADRKDEVGLLIHRFNTLAETLRRERMDIYQRELVPETILAITSIIVVMTNEAGRIVYSNAAAREFFAGGKPIDGRDLRELIAAAPPELVAAVESADDLLFSCPITDASDPDTFHLFKRYFEFSMQRHTLYILRRLTKELARKEVETWKKAIRVLSHEVNNSLAPVSSLVHSARLMLDNPTHAQRLRGALDTIEERAGHLRTFLDGYASIARLPQPAKRSIGWSELLGGVEGLYPFKVVGAVPERPAYVDPAQMQQVLINLLKNASESGSPAEEIGVEIRAGIEDGTELWVVDRGKGMPDEVLRNALLPFYSTKKSGSGLGLALCREIVDAHGGRLTLHPRESGGIAVRCWLPTVLAPN
ncbi:MAG TPA: ATP-binding protein [Polyangia bacterium]|nr:ATP-binding protein [Polyangia bacterium]